ncbi:MAG: hypothetical protein JW854_14585 [Actinobacteria bacterium]|nr:hypothetical protein [Actinomycetota bacterium]
MAQEKDTRHAEIRLAGLEEIQERSAFVIFSFPALDIPTPCPASFKSS